MNIKDYIRDIKDFPKPGIIFRDITPLLHDPKAFKYVIGCFSEAAQHMDVIAGIEARGFIFASAVALQLQKPLVVIRKAGKLPYKTYTAKYDLEYGSAELQIHQDIPIGDVCLIDDVLATGGTAIAATSLLSEAGCSVELCLFLLELDFLNGRDRVKSSIFSLTNYQE
jgi:adenine phosphoribosyltransferase